MNAREYVKTQLEALNNVEAHATRVPIQTSDEKGLPPTHILYSEISVPTEQRIELLGGPTDSFVRFFQLECRSKNAETTVLLARNALESLRSRTSHILADYDEPDDESQKQGGYYSHILHIGISEA